MASKKLTGYYVFLQREKYNEVLNGKTPVNMKYLAIKLIPVWCAMTKDQRSEYRKIARKINLRCSAKSSKHLKEHASTHNDNDDRLVIETKVKKMFESITDEKQVLNKKFLLLHVNYHYRNGEKYFPAEIAVQEFSLLNGISRTYHQIIGNAKVCPTGCCSGMFDYSHQVSYKTYWHEHPFDYKKISRDLIFFLKEGIDNEDGLLDLPFLFTFEPDECIQKAKWSIQKLFKTRSHGFEQIEFNPTHELQIVHIRLLFSEIVKKMSLTSIALRSWEQIFSTVDDSNRVLGLGCLYHHNSEHNCSKARVRRWMCSMCNELHEHIGLNLIPGKHNPPFRPNRSLFFPDNKNETFSSQDLPTTL